MVLEKSGCANLFASFLMKYFILHSLKEFNWYFQHFLSLFHLSIPYETLLRREIPFSHHSKSSLRSIYLQRKILKWQIISAGRFFAASNRPRRQDRLLAQPAPENFIATCWKLPAISTWLERGISTVKYWLLLRPYWKQTWERIFHLATKQTNERKKNGFACLWINPLGSKTFAGLHGSVLSAAAVVVWTKYRPETVLCKFECKWVVES